jgi:diketogulonate reductase-like aldo/keto reductase
MTEQGFTRREAIRLGFAALAFSACPWARAAEAPLMRRIPASGEAVPAVGLGSWISFNVGDDPVARARCATVIRAFFDAGGRLIDSSPMYGSAQAVIGAALRKHGLAERVFAADKVWIADGDAGLAQVGASRRHWGVRRFDLMQVHNLLSWREHLRTLFTLKEQRRLRYVGITTSEGRRHDEIEKIMRNERIDFVQFSYNVLDREAERRLLPLARDRGIAVICNRPFRQGELTERLAREPLPPLATELRCTSWAQLLLKFILAHPAVTCAIPATGKVAHVRENLAAAGGPLPDTHQKRALIAYVEAL